MLDRYQKIVTYDLSVKCLTPLRSGAYEGDTESVLRRPDGRAFVQAASLAGAFSDWLKESGSAACHEALFGSQKREGSLVFSDLVFSSAAEQQTRPRLRIDGVTGTAAAKAKFDIAHLAVGTEGETRLVWFGDDENSPELLAVQALLSALNDGFILLGAQKSNGFGRLAVTARKAVYDMKKPEDRRAWIEGTRFGEPLALSSGKESRLVRFTVTGKLPNVLVKASTADYSEGSLIGNIRENGTALIPGSSVKGAVRAQMERIADRFPDGAALCERLFGREAKEGDNGVAGTVRFSDVILSSEKTARVTRIRINRFTGGVMRGALFSEETLSSPVRMSVLVPDSPEACAMLLFALRDLGLGLYGFGSGASIGRGLLTEAEIRAEAPGDRDLTLKFDRGRKAQLTDATGLWKEWAGALEGGKA